MHDIAFFFNIISYIILYIILTRYILYSINYMIYILYIITDCVAQLAKVSDTQAVGHGFEYRPDP